MGIVILLILFFLLYAWVAIDGSRKKPRFPKAMIYAIFTQLPIRENVAPYISSTPPIRYSFLQKNCTESNSNKEKEDNDKGSKKDRR